MARILAVGNATLDIINTVDGYPPEDSEVRALSQEHRRGGNATNTLVVLSLLGHDCAWAGSLADEPDARLILEDLQSHHIDTSALQHSSHGKVPTSYVTLNSQNGSRTIVHYRDLVEYSFTTFSQIELSRFDWVHFEGRNITETEKMLEYLREHHPDTPISIEFEKVRDGIEQLYGYADLLFFSQDYARQRNFSNAESFLKYLSSSINDASLICSWGDKGACGVTAEGKAISTPAFPPARLIDTLGAGDTFNASIIDNLVKGKSLDVALTEASRLAGKKCGYKGFAGFLD